MSRVLVHRLHHSFYFNFYRVQRCICFAASPDLRGEFVGGARLGANQTVRHVV